LRKKPPKPDQKKAEPETELETEAVPKKKIEKPKKAQAPKIHDEGMVEDKKTAKGGKRKVFEPKQPVAEKKRPKRDVKPQDNVQSCAKTEPEVPVAESPRDECETVESDSIYSEAVPLVEPESSGSAVEHPHENDLV
jgi:hypothetical protein